MSPAYTRLLAYCGDPDARFDEIPPAVCVYCGYEAEDWLCSGCANMDSGSPTRDPAAWVAGLPALVREATELECGMCALAEPFRKGMRRGSATHAAHPFPCRCGCRAMDCLRCKGTGKVTEPSHPMLRLAVAGAWACYYSQPTPIDSSMARWPEERKALSAAEAWLADASAANFERWAQAWKDVRPVAPLWIPAPAGGPVFHLTAQAQVLGLPALREALREEVQRWLTQPSGA